MPYDKENLAWVGEPEVKTTERTWDAEAGVWYEKPIEKAAPKAPSKQAPKKVEKKTVFKTRR